MSEWEQLIKGEEKQQLLEWVKKQALIGMVRGTVKPKKSFLEAIGWLDNCYQVVYCRRFSAKLPEERYHLSELLFFEMPENSRYFNFQEDEGDILVLCGKNAVECMRHFVEHYCKTPPQKGSPMYSIFFTCGSVVKRVEDIQTSYRVAIDLMRRRFFAVREQHMMAGQTPAVPAFQSGEPHRQEDVARFCDMLMDSIQTFNKSLLDRQMECLQDYLLNDQGEQEVRMFLTELYMKTRWKLQEKYDAAENDQECSSVLKSIYEGEYLYEILDDFSQDMDRIMHAIGSPSRDSVLNDILFYIQHNIGEQLKLEKIAPLFGYNSAYLGKIFRQNVGESFNSYVDRVRIQRAKELLVQDRMKVYEISERVGYRNVDYFHKKFLKYVQMSPAAYRRQQLGEEQNMEK